MESLVRFDISELKPKKAVYQCPKCKDMGFTTITTEAMGNIYTAAQECECQIPIRIAQMLAFSGVSPEQYAKFTLDSFKTEKDFQKKMKQNALNYLVDDKANGIGFFGKSGIGKTHICIAICNELTHKRLIPHQYFQYNTEIRRLQASRFNEEDYAMIFNTWVNAPLLYIDDLFKIALDKRTGQINDNELKIMFELINARYLNKKKTIFSSEFTLNELGTYDEALASRIYEMVKPYGLGCDGDNYRLAVE